MALVKTFDKYEMQELFRKFDRDYYSLDGYEAILNLFDETETNVEMDVIAICCDFNESTSDDIREEYDNLDRIKEAEDDDELLEALNYYTYAVRLDNGSILYTAF